MLCPFAASLWNLCLAWFGMCCVHPKTLQSLFSSRLSQALRNENQWGLEVWKLLPTAICCSIWEERNRRIFEGVSCPFHKLVDVMLSRIYDCLSSSSRVDCPPYRSWIFDWDSFIIMAYRASFV